MNTLSRRDVLTYSALMGGTAFLSTLHPGLGSAAQNLMAGMIMSRGYLLIGDAKSPIRSLLSMQAANPSQLQVALAWAFTKPLVDWMLEALARKSLQRPGAVEFATPAGQLAQYSWADGVVAQLQFPPCDATSAVDDLTPVLTIQAGPLSAKPVEPAPQGWGSPTPRWYQNTFRVDSNASGGIVDFRRTLSVSALNLSPRARGGTVGVVLAFGLEHPEWVNPLIQVASVGGQLLPGQPTSLTVNYLDRRFQLLASVTLNGCRLTAVSPSSPQPPSRSGRTALTFDFMDASFRATIV